MKDPFFLAFRPLSLLLRRIDRIEAGSIAIVRYYRSLALSGGEEGRCFE